MLSLLISAKKLYFSDDNSFYDVIIKELVRKWHHKYGQEMPNNPFAELSVFYTYSITFNFRPIDKANFTICGPSSLIKNQLLISKGSVHTKVVLENIF